MGLLFIGPPRPIHRLPQPISRKQYVIVPARIERHIKESCHDLQIVVRFLALTIVVRKAQAREVFRDGVRSDDSGKVLRSEVRGGL